MRYAYAQFVWLSLLLNCRIYSFCLLFVYNSIHTCTHKLVPAFQSLYGFCSGTDYIMFTVHFACLFVCAELHVLALYLQGKQNYVLPPAVSCGPAPNAPANGQRNVSGGIFGSTVTYSCNRGYTLQGDSRRTCMANGQWSGRTPTCSGTLVLYAIR